MSRKWIIFIFKILLVFGLMAYFYHLGELDFAGLFNKLKMPSEWVIPVLLLIVAFVFSAFRWKVILDEVFLEKVPFKTILSMYWIGVFFNFFLPGKSGEVSMIYYSNKLGEKFKVSVLVVALLLDNVFGLIGLLLVSVLGLFVAQDQYTVIMSDKNLIPGLAFIIFALVIFILIFVFSPKAISLLSNLTKPVEFLHKWITEIRDFDPPKERKKHMFIKAVGLSFLSQFLKCLSFYFLISHLLGNKDLIGISLIPLGLLLTNLVSNTGVGIGHGAFSLVFDPIGIDNGAGLYNYYLIVLTIVSLLGIIPFLISRITLIEKDNSK